MFKTSNKLVKATLISLTTIFLMSGCSTAESESQDYKDLPKDYPASVPVAKDNISDVTEKKNGYVLTYKENSQSLFYVLSDQLQAGGYKEVKVADLPKGGEKQTDNGKEVAYQLDEQLAVLMWVPKNGASEMFGDHEGVLTYEVTER
jgi:hypothetical protein